MFTHKQEDDFQLTEDRVRLLSLHITQCDHLCKHFAAENDQGVAHSAMQMVMGTLAQICGYGLLQTTQMHSSA